MKVLLAATADVYREALCASLGEAGAEVGVCDLALAAVEELAGSLRPDVAVLSLPAPEPAHVDLVRSACGAAGGCPVLVLGALAPRTDIAGMLACGAAGYILTSATVDEVVRAVAALALAGPSPDHIREATARFRPAALPGAFPDLTERQTVILEMVSRGLGYRQIGKRMMVSHWVVKAEIGKVLKLVGARNRAELVALAHRAGLLSRSGSATGAE
ncbi:MAG: response regulator transcription factor [Bacillota bacterium]|nr:response regulator transcription factor [Bacillota bacterium]